MSTGVGKLNKQLNERRLGLPLVMSVASAIILSACTSAPQSEVTQPQPPAPETSAPTTPQVTAPPTETPDVSVANQSNPGETLDIKACLGQDKYTIVDFSSEFCPSCRRISPVLHDLAKSRSDIAVRTLDINRTGVQGIDWDSPLAKQYDIHSIPQFKIFDTNGKLMAEGGDAKRQVMDWIHQSGGNM